MTKEIPRNETVSMLGRCLDCSLSSVWFLTSFLNFSHVTMWIFQLTWNRSICAPMAFAFFGPTSIQRTTWNVLEKFTFRISFRSRWSVRISKQLWQRLEIKLKWNQVHQLQTMQFHNWFWRLKARFLNWARFWMSLKLWCFTRPPNHVRKFICWKLKRWSFNS